MGFCWGIGEDAKATLLFQGNILAWKNPVWTASSYCIQNNCKI